MNYLMRWVLKNHNHIIFLISGVASLGISDYQQLENLTLRKHLGLENRDGGIRVCSVDPLGACSDLKPNDVLMKVNGVPIGEDGTVEVCALFTNYLHVLVNIIAIISF